MKRSFLGKAILALTAATFLMHENANAQNPPLTDGQIKANLSTARFFVNTPASISGLKKVTVATWGGQITAPINNVQVAKGLDSLGAANLTNPTAVAGKFCLLYRGGGISFVDKATRAQSAGAIGLIIVNNIPGDPVPMGGTTTAITIPVIMVSDVDGNAMNTQLRNSLAVSITLAAWSLGHTHDLAILNGYGAMPHAKNIPLSMWSNSNNNPVYKNWVGGAIFNYGSATETNVSVMDSIVWTGTGSSTTTLEKQNTYTIASIAPIDSVKFGFGPASAAYWLTPKATTGRYDYYSRISYANTDGAPQDNNAKFSQYITDSIFCKGEYDYTRNEPYISQGIRPASGTNDYVMGPMYFITRNNYAARKIQFYMSKNSVTTLDGILGTALVLKWKDGSGSTTADNFMDGDEVTLVGFTARTFTTDDSNGHVFSFDVMDATNPDRRVVLDSNSWYWIGVQAPPDCFIGVDQKTSYFTRAYVQSQNGTHDFPEAIFVGGISTLVGDAGQGASNFPFALSAVSDSVRYDRYNEVANVALHLSKTAIGPNTGVGRTTLKIGEMKVFPNPAENGFFNVSINLDKQADKVTYRLMDGMGRMITDIVHNNVKTETFQYSTSGLAAGTYYLLVHNGTGSMIQKLTIK